MVAGILTTNSMSAQHNQENMTGLKDKKCLSLQASRHSYNLQIYGVLVTCPNRVVVVLRVGDLCHAGRTCWSSQTLHSLRALIYSRRKPSSSA